MTDASSRPQGKAMPSRARQAPTNIPSLNGARGLAALMVLMSHAANMGLLPHWLGEGAGQMGVILFFALSGFLMSHLYADRAFDDREVPRYIRHRIGRVVPLYLALVLASYVCTRLIDGQVLYNIGWNLERHLLFISGTSVLWTIPVEVHYYVLFLFLWWAGLFRHAGLMLAAIVALPPLSLAADQFIQAERHNYLLYWVSPFLVGGLIGFHYKRWYAALTTWLAEPGRARLVALVGWGFVPVFIWTLPGIRRLTGVEALFAWIDPITLISPCIFLLLTLVEAGPFGLLRASVLQYLGKISYAVYLFHLPILIHAHDHVEPVIGAPATMVGVVVATVAAASLSFYLFERPMQRVINNARLPLVPARRRS